MSNPDSQDPNPQVEELLQRGIEAAKAGDKQTARSLLEQVVQHDEQNEMGWFWLAAVVEDDIEKRTCLGNVLVINPDNERARRLLLQMEEQKATSQLHTTLREEGGTNRRALYIAAITGLGAVIVLVLLLTTVLGGDKDEDDPAAPPANTSAPASDNADEGNDEPLPPAVAAERTQQAAAIPPTNTPAPSATFTSSPPTWTPIPSATPIPAQPPTLYAPVAASVGGQIIIQTGDVPGDTQNQPIALIRPDGTDKRIIAGESERGHTPIISPDGSLYAYIKYAPGTRDVLLELNNFQGTAPKAASAFWSGVPILSEQNTPTWSPNGRLIAFTASGMGTAVSDLYVVDATNQTGSRDALLRVTQDDAAESWPAFAPDSTRIVYAADLSRVQLDPATELRIYNLETGTTTDLTSNGLALTEAAPDWSPDGGIIVFHAHAAEDPPSDTDIYWMPADGSAPAERLIDSDASDIRPRFSPDGRYIVFSSNRTGNWDVFIFDTTSGSYYQVTSDPATDIANDWG